MFNAAQHLIKLKGKDYLPVAARLAWINHDEKSFVIKTEIVQMSDTHAIVRATVTIFSEEKDIAREATAVKREDKAHFADFLEKAETGSVGRALGMLGFGTLHTEDFDEIPNPNAPDANLRPVDKPVTPKPSLVDQRPNADSSIVQKIDDLFQQIIGNDSKALAVKSTTYTGASSLRAAISAKMHHRPETPPAKQQSLYNELYDIAQQLGMLP
jgi:predicted nucleic-acid-binding protein